LSNLIKGLILVGVIVAIGFGLVVWKKKVGGQGNESLNSISRQEVEMLLADVAKSNPTVLKRFTEDPEMKKTQLENLKQLLRCQSGTKRRPHKRPYKQTRTRKYSKRDHRRQL